MNNESDMKRGVSSVKRHYNPSILSETAMDKLTEMESVLKWASENVMLAYGPLFGNEWIVTFRNSGYSTITSPTLYEALWSAWKSVHLTNKDVM